MTKAEQFRQDWEDDHAPYLDPAKFVAACKNCKHWQPLGDRGHCPIKGEDTTPDFCCDRHETTTGKED